MLTIILLYISTYALFHLWLPIWRCLSIELVKWILRLIEEWVLQLRLLRNNLLFIVATASSLWLLALPITTQLLYLLHKLLGGFELPAIEDVFKSKQTSGSLWKLTCLHILVILLGINFLYDIIVGVWPKDRWTLLIGTYFTQYRVRQALITYLKVTSMSWQACKRVRILLIIWTTRSTDPWSSIDRLYLLKHIVILRALPP